MKKIGGWFAQIRTSMSSGFSKKLVSNRVECLVPWTQSRLKKQFRLCRCQDRFPAIGFGFLRTVAVITYSAVSAMPWACLMLLFQASLESVSVAFISRSAIGDRRCSSISGEYCTRCLPPTVTIIGLTLSWNTILIDLYPWMIETLKIATIIFQCIFALVTLFVHNRSEFLTYIDVVISIVSIFADWYWFATDRWCNMDSGDLVYFSLLLGYMTLRTWYNAVRARTWSWRSKVGTKLTSNNVDKLTFVWITRSAPLVSKIVPDIIHIWNSLANAWGEQAANKVCNISIYITDKDKAACDALRAEIGESSLFRSGAIRFCRPDIQKLIEGHTLDRINDERGVPTTTLLAFCGSPSLSSKIQQAKIKNDISAVITGNGHHQMEFVSESYGASKSNNKARYAVDGAEDGETGSRLLLSKRRTSIYGPMKGRGTIIGPNGEDTRLLAYSFEEGLDAYCEVIQASTSSQST